MSTIAFIPVRGGSKSIPLKNIKFFCGKPLVCWLIEAFEHSSQIDEIIVATDSDEIADIVSKKTYKKTNIYKRSEENARDTSSTESVMLEYLYNNPQIDANTIFILAQATTPFTEASQVDAALNQYWRGGYDSLITCSTLKKFFWSKDGAALNYDFNNRPRRQDFDGVLTENGAFYVSKVGAILQSKCRLSGTISVFELPEYFLTEIDELDDWNYAELLMRKYVLKKSSNKIKLFITDVDGVLTDAGMYYTENGDELKKFNTHDGMAFELLRRNGIKTAIVTSEQTKIVERRAAKLKVDYLFQSKREGGKLAAAVEICEKENISLEEVAYIGDDINCLDLLSNVGWAACPYDAIETIKQIQGIFQLSKAGGEGVVREFVELILTKV
ncbi:MAG: HAD family hydrolase [Ferruginibacter sp.]